MSASFESRKNSQATMITIGFAGLAILLMFLIRWSIPEIMEPVADTGIEINLQLPEEEFMSTRESGGGGGGNPVQMAGAAGAAPYAPPLPGEAEPSKDVVTDDNDKSSPEITKPANTQPNAKKVAENHSTVKTTPKPIIENPQPKKKAVMGGTVSGNGRGGGAAEDYDRTGGTGTGAGVGTGSGTGGGRGTGAGGGTGSGVGSGTGPRVTRGDRTIVTAYNFQGDLNKATIYADIRVNADGTGKFVGFSRGSTSTSAAYKTAIIQYLRNIKFNKADHESTVTVQFNFKVTG